MCYKGPINQFHFVLKFLQVYIHVYMHICYKSTKMKEIVNWGGFKCNSCRFRDELHRYQSLHWNCKECIPEIEHFLFGFFYRYDQ